LLVLAGKVVFADRPADAIELIPRLALGMQGLTLPAPEASRPQDRLDLVCFIFFGDRRDRRISHSS
jgi:hypothetical protein